MKNIESFYIQNVLKLFEKNFKIPLAITRIHAINLNLFLIQNSLNQNLLNCILSELFIILTS